MPTKNISAKLAPKFVGLYKLKKKESCLTYELVHENYKSKGLFIVQDMK